MDNKNIIIRLIQADMKHNQLICALESINLLTDGLYCINIADAVYGLMNRVGNDNDHHHPNSTNAKPDLWSEAYYDYMIRAGDIKIDGRGTLLRPLAEECYQHLCGMM